MQKPFDNKKFYNELAADYDSMIYFENSIVKKRNLLKTFIQPETKFAADIGCGTGVDSISLALNGLNVTAFDPSSEMLKQAELNAQKFKVKIDYKNFSLVNIPKKFSNKFDLVISLGNTIPNIPDYLLKQSLKRCYDLLKPGGRLLIQFLNYKKILSAKQRIVSITESKDRYFVRFYDFLNNKIIFYILTFRKENKADFKIISTRIYLYNKKYLESELKSTGFKTVKCYSDLSFTKFDSVNSRDLIISAYR